jgi:hypothetical protein
LQLVTWVCCSTTRHYTTDLYNLYIITQTKFLKHVPNMPSSSSPSSSVDAAESARRTSEARAAVTASLQSVGTSVDSQIRTRTADLHANSAAISKQEKELARATATLAKQSKEWEKVLQGGTKKLNEVGDVQNWAEMLERDLLVLEETVRLLEEKNGSTGAETGRVV